MIRRLALVTILLATFPSAALADLYVGGGLGQASFKDDVSNVTFEESTAGWKVFGGVRPLKFFGVEASYIDFGSLDGTEGGVSWEADTTGWDGFVMGVLPIAFVELFAKAGFVYAELETTVSGNSLSDNEFDPAYGIGAAIVLGETLGIRADDLNMYGVGVELRFLTSSSRFKSRTSPATAWIHCGLVSAQRLRACAARGPTSSPTGSWMPWWTTTSSCSNSSATR